MILDWSPVSAQISFNVTVGSKNSTHPEYGRGHLDGYSIDGVQGKELTLIRGQAYTFNVNSTLNHPFYLTTGSLGNISGRITDDVVEGVLTFTPTASTPNLIYYQCSYHNNMGWKINIVDTSTPKPIPTPTITPTTTPSPASAVTSTPIPIPTPIPVESIQLQPKSLPPSPPKPVSKSISGTNLRTNCGSQPKPTLSCPTGYSIMCIFAGGDHWGCGKESNGPIAEWTGDPTKKNEESVVQNIGEERQVRARALLDNPKAVETEDDLKDYAKGLIDSDTNIKKLAVANNEVEILYSQPGKLFGIIPVNYGASVKVDSVQKVKVKFPWWTVFVKKSQTLHEQGLASEIEGKLQQLQLQEQMNRLSQTMNILSNILKSKHDAAINSIRNIK